MPLKDLAIKSYVHGRYVSVGYAKILMLINNSVSGYEIAYKNARIYCDTVDLRIFQHSQLDIPGRLGMFFHSYGHGHRRQCQPYTSAKASANFPFP